MPMPKVIPTWVWLVAIMVAFSGGTLAGYNFGTARRDAAAGRQAAEHLDEQRTGAANTEGVRQEVNRPAAVASVQSKEATDEAQERIRIVYRDVPAPADCTPAPGVRVVLDEAHERASRAVRAAASGAAPEVPDRR